MQMMHPRTDRLARPDPWEIAARAAEDRAAALTAQFRAIGARFSLPRILARTPPRTPQGQRATR